MSNPTPEENGELARLSRSINRLQESTVDQMVRQARMTKAHRRFLWALTVSSILGALLTVALVIGFIQLNSVTHDVETEQSTTRSQVLCPLYQAFVNVTDTPEEREAGRKRSSDPEEYDRSVKVIREGYKVLRCDEFKEGPG